jgi:GT2 family glycosyltransferase
MRPQASCAVIIVTHNSEKTIRKTMESLAQQTRPADKVVIVDSGSSSLSYLAPYQEMPHIQLHAAAGDIGFCCANNLGMRRLGAAYDYIFLLNPDAFLTPSYLEEAIAFMEDPAHVSCAALTGTLLGYDIERDAPSGKYDSRGIFRTWYGKWIDRSQGEEVISDQAVPGYENIPALCGAAFFCRQKALQQVLIGGKELFDPAFFMYKEDIDLSLRLREKGWTLAFLPHLTLHHCRGWKKNRAEMPRRMRLCSARNELRLHWRSKEPLPLAYSLLKFAAVKWMDM